MLVNKSREFFFKLYKGFYDWIEKPEFLKTRKGFTYEYSDVYPLLYLKMRLEGLTVFSDVKHLVEVPFVSEKNYHTPADRQMLYVACTRAMHRLMLT
ncbi:MAG: hypothetical protein WDZ45_07780 [Flavobacteriaceae bacterium]